MQIPVHFNLEIPIPKANESHRNMKIRVMDHTRDVCVCVCVCVFAKFPPGVDGRVKILNSRFTCPRPEGVAKK